MSAESSKSNELKRRRQPSQCRVCYSPATYSYFDSISCEACKVFFRRNAQHGQVCCIVLKKHFFIEYCSLESSAMCTQ